MRSAYDDVLAMIRRMSHAAPRFASLDALRLQVWTARPDGTLDFVNAFVASYFGVTRERVLEHGWKDLCHPFDLISATQRWTSSLASGDPYEVYFRLLRSEDRQFRWHVGRAEAVRSDAGEILGWIGSNADIDEVRRAAEVADAQANQLRRELNATHGKDPASQ